MYVKKQLLGHLLLQFTPDFIIVIMSDGFPALVTLKTCLVALARQWMKFIVVTTAMDYEHEDGLGLDNGGGLQSDTSADEAEFEFNAGNSSLWCFLAQICASSINKSLFSNIPL
jgi:hypothetical protein